MARYQIERGNPANKSSFIIDNFSGGMDTQTSPDSAPANSFRKLLNVDLTETGVAKKRKGFQESKMVRKVFEGYLNKDIITIRKLYDKNGIFSLIEASQGAKSEKETLKSKLLRIDDGKKARILVVFEEEEKMVFDVITLTTDKSSDTGFTISNEEELKIFKETLETSVNGEVVFETIYKNYKDVKKRSSKNIAKIDFINHTDFSYLNLNDISEDLDGFLRIKADEDVIEGKIISLDYEENLYKPSSFEMSMGFNLIAPNPQTFINSSDRARIINVFVTDKEDKFMEGIPRSGLFKIKVLTSGGLTQSNISLSIKRELSNGEREDISFDTESTTLLDNLITYDVRLETSEERLFVEVSPRNDKEFYPSFNEPNETPEGEVPFFNNITSLEYFYSFLQGEEVKRVTENISKSRFWVLDEKKENATLYERKDGNYVFRNDTPVQDLKTEFHPNYSRNLDGDYLEFVEEVKEINGEEITQKVAQRVRIESGVKTVNAWFIKQRVLEFPVSNETIVAGETHELFSSSYTPELNEKNRMIPNKNKIYRVGNYNGQEGDWFLNFDEQSDGFILSDFQKGDIVDFDTFFSSFRLIDDNTGSRISGMELKDYSMIEVNNRLVVYKENTLFFSDLYDFTYFPSRYYVTLSLDVDDKITKVYYFRGNYIVFTRNKIFKFFGEFATQNFSLTLVNDQIGCIAGESIKSINNNLVFLSGSGLFALKNHYFADELENVEKIDTEIRDIVPRDDTAYGFIDNGIYYLLFNKEEDYDALKFYFEIPALRGRVNAFTIDKYETRPDVIFNFGRGKQAFSFKRKMIATFNYGFRDFFNELSLEEEGQYDFVLETIPLNFHYPTHEKKIRELFIKTVSKEKFPIMTKVSIDGYITMSPEKQVISYDSYGSVIYEKIDNPAFITEGSRKLGNFELDISRIGDGDAVNHRVRAVGRGTNVSVSISQKTPYEFKIRALDFGFKIGKRRKTSRGV